MGIDIQNIEELEHAFADNFGTPYFPVLADYYLKNKDFNRAQKVCELGLKSAPYNTDGKFILSKVHLYQNKVIQGERLLKQVVDENPVHIIGLRILIEVMCSLKRSKKSIKKYVRRILDVLPEDTEALALLSELDNPETIEKPPVETPVEDVPEFVKNTTDDPTVLPPVKEKTKPPKSVPAKVVVAPPEEVVFDVKMNMATFTMVNVLKSQKNYRQALSILSKLEEKGADAKRIKKARTELEKLLAQQD
jgi:tetratricopeptide (TPR) repeat protein